MSVHIAALATFPENIGLEPVDGPVDESALTAALRMRGLRPLSRTARLAMVAAAAVWSEGPDPSRDATVLGSRWASSAPLAEFVAVAAAEGVDRVFPMAFPNTVASVHAGYVASLLGLTGPVVTLCGEGAGLETVVEACSLLAAGRADRVLAVAAEAAEPPVVLARPAAAEASCALRLTRDPDGALAEVTGCWVGARADDLPPGSETPAPDGVDLGAVRGLLDLAAAVRTVTTQGRSVTVSGRCGVRGAVTLRLAPPLGLAHPATTAALPHSEV